MRKNLKNKLLKDNKVKKYKAVFDRVGYFTHKDAMPSPTICLKNIVDESYNLIADHMWFRYSINFRKVGELKKGDQLTFTAQTRSYYKGQAHSKKEDYKLTEPKNVRLISRQQLKPLPHTKRLILGYVLNKNNVNSEIFSEDYVSEYLEWLKSRI